VAITPGSGYVPPWAALIYGIVAGVTCNMATKLKIWIRVDDALDVFAIHAVGGFLGDLMTGLFASHYIAALDGTTDISGGWVDGHWVQLAIQLADGVTGMTYSFVLSCLILFAISYIPGMHLRASDADEIMGMDECEVGEFAYDYVEVDRDVANSAEETTALRRGQLGDSQVDMNFRGYSDDISLRAYAEGPGMKQ